MCIRDRKIGRTKGIKNDSKPERKEIPNNKTMEPVVVLPEKKTNGNKENTKDKDCLLYTSYVTFCSRRTSSAQLSIL